MSNESVWFKKVQQLQLPAVLPVKLLPQANAPLNQWMDAIREDPLLTIHLFRHANKMLASREVSVRTLDHAVTLLGSTRLVTLTGKIPRIKEQSASSKGLLRTIGDSLLAASLLRQWFEIRQIPWTEADYWMSLFYDLGLWICWLLEPDQMQGIEYKVAKGGDRDLLIQEMIGMPLKHWNEKLCAYFQLPVLHESDLDTVQTDTRVQPYKQSALKFFLPFSHELASSVRQDWNSPSMEALCRTGEISLGLTEFRPMLKRWVAIAAREYSLPHAATAARRLLAQQPDTRNSRVSTGFSEQDIALASHLAQQPAPRKESTTAAWPEADKINNANNLPPILTVKVNQPLVELNDTVSGKQSQTEIQRSTVNLNIQREIRRQFRNQKTWHSPVEIQESALYGLKNGLSISRVVALEVNNGFWQTFHSVGCQSFPLLRYLKMPMHSSDILIELSKRVTALWVSKNNRIKAGKQLPPPLMTAAAEDNFFLRSFAIDNQITMLLYADAYGQDQPLNSIDYQLFREYCADWNTALNRMRL